MAEFSGGTAAVGAWRVVTAASLGNVLEWYDFIVFSFLAPQIAVAFFPHGSLLLALSTFGASFLARPVGAAVIGGYADRRGRRGALTLSIGLMAFGTLLMVVMPRFSAVGDWSAFGILLARLIQGFSAGGEFGGATALMIEHAPRRAGFFGSFQNLTQSLASLLGSVVVWGLTAWLSPAAMAGYGFRLPFALGLLIAPVGWYIRRRLPEILPGSGAEAPEQQPVLALLRRYPGRVALGACVIAVGTASTYLNLYLPTYARKHLHMAATHSFALAAGLSLAPVFVTPLAGILADSAGVLPPMLAGSAAMVVLSLPGFLLIGHAPSAALLGAVLLLLTLLRAFYAAPMPALLGLLFPTRLRGAGMSIAYTMGVVMFGGFAQLVMEWLIEQTGNAAIPGYYLLLTAAVTLAALITIARRVSFTMPHP